MGTEKGYYIEPDKAKKNASDDGEITIVSLKGAEHPEGVEYHGDLEWKQVDETDFLYQHAGWQGKFPSSPGADDSGSGDVIRQFVDAAKGQPGVAFGFLTRSMGTPTVVIKWEDDKLWLGTEMDPEAFAAVDGNDGDGDEDDLVIYPTGGVKESRGVSHLVNRILQETISEEDADQIALRLLGGLK